MLDHALDVAREAALEAGTAIRGFYQDEYTVRDKGEDNPLTDADLAANTILERRLRSAFPDFGWLSEETADTPERLDKRWWLREHLRWRHPHVQHGRDNQQAAHTKHHQAHCPVCIVRRAHVPFLDCQHRGRRENTAKSFFRAETPICQALNTRAF